MSEYSDFAAWERAGRAAGHSGPLRAQGFNRWQFLHEGKVVGVWSETRGHLANGPIRR